MSTVEDLLKNHQAKVASIGGVVGGAVEGEADPVKTAAELGMREGEKLMKVSAFLGETIADSFMAKVAAFMGYEPDVVKQANFQDLMQDTMLKIAEDVQGTSVQAVQTQNETQQHQIDETAAHHANMAVACAGDALQCVQQGDHHSANMQIEAANSHLEQAQGFAQQTTNPEVHAHVAEAAQAVQAHTNQAVALAQQA